MPKITTKGQVTVPKNVREDMGIRPGDNVIFEKSGGKFILKKKVKDFPLKKYLGYLKNKNRKSVDDIIKELRGD